MRGPSPVDNPPLTSPTAVLHKLLQRESFLQAEVLQKQTAPAGVPSGITSSASKPAQGWALLPGGPQVLPGVW